MKKDALPVLICNLLIAAGVAGQTYTIDTLAGGGLQPTPVPATIAAAVPFSSVNARGNTTVLDAAGNLYFTSRNAVFRLGSTGILTLVAGSPGGGPPGDGGPATSAHLYQPSGLAVDSAGNLYIADCGHSLVRKVTPAGIISTVAGNLVEPRAVAVDSAGNLYVSELSDRVSKVAPDGTILTVAGNGQWGYSGDGGPATAAKLGIPAGLAVDSAGNLYIADFNNGRIRKVDGTGTISTVARSRGPQGPWAVAVDSAGNLYIAESGDNLVTKVTPDGATSIIVGGGPEYGYNGDGGPASAARLNIPVGVAVDSTGNVYFADSGNYRIRKVAADGIISTVAGTGDAAYLGDGGPATAAQLSGPRGVGTDWAGNAYIADGNRIRKVTPNGTITTFAGTGVPGYAGDGGPAANAQIGPGDVAVDSAGSVYFTEANRIRKVAPDGIISTVAGTGARGYSGDGGPATKAQLNYPGRLALDSSGNLYLADTGNYRVRKVAPDGTISTVAGNGTLGHAGDGGPATDAQTRSSGIALDLAGNLYISDDVNNCIRKVDVNGTISTVAGNCGGSGGVPPSGDGGQATSAVLALVAGMVVDSGGSLYFGDLGRVRKVAPEGTISTVAGDGKIGYSGDGGPAISARFYQPIVQAVDAAGRVYVTDNWNGVIRILTSTCTPSVSPVSLQSPVDGTNLTLAITTGQGCAWAVSKLPDWVTVSGSLSGFGSGAVTLAIAPNSGAPRSALISVGGIAVSINQASSVLLVSAGGVVNAASYTTPVAPGSIAAIFGNFLLAAPVSTNSFPIPTVLGGLSFQFSGAPSPPLFYAGLGQVNAQVPWELDGQPQATIAVTIDSRTGASVAVNLATYAPGIFALNGAGTGQGAILDENYHLVDSTNPAIAGTTVLQIYCTGLGPVTNRPATGAPAPLDPLARTTTMPTVMIGGAEAVVQFAGLTPGCAGLYQVNAQVPRAATKGSAVPVTISMGGVQSNTVTIAVQ